MPTVYLNIGSNQGDRAALIERAVALIARAFPEARLRRSRAVVSEPWGYDSPHPYLNLGVALDFSGGIDPLALLHTLQGIERRVDASPHRNADGTYRDRGIDIDIVAVDRMRVNTPELTLPHPRAALRPFVMEPLAETAPPEVVEWVRASGEEGADDGE